MVIPDTKDTELTRLRAEVERLKQDLALIHKHAVRPFYGGHPFHAEGDEHICVHCRNVELKRERDEALAQVVRLRLKYVCDLRRLSQEQATEGISANLVTNIEQATSNLMEAVVRDRTRALLDRLHELEKEPVITLPDARNVSIGELVELYLEQSERLQRAEAVVKEVKSLIPHGYLNPDGGREEAFPRHYVDSLRKALAAWEEGRRDA